MNDCHCFVFFFVCRIDIIFFKLQRISGIGDNFFLKAFCRKANRKNHNKRNPTSFECLIMLLPELFMSLSENEGN